MAFAFDIGITFASTAYSFLTDSGLNSSNINAQTYTEYANVVSESGQIPYNIGSMAYNMDINYGLSAEYDLMLKMTISYNNSSHKLNDFTLNFVERDKWSIDTPTSFENIVQEDEDKTTHYSITSNSNTLTISMYYLGSLTGAGTLSVISGVTFYDDYLGRTSNNLAINVYESDYLTIVVEPYYTKSSNSNLSTYYSTSHAFYQNAVGDKTAFVNWCNYKANNNSTSTYMIYNSHGTDSTAILFPQDFVCPTDIANISDVEIISNSTTAYEYLLSNASGRDVLTYSKLLAGNKYSGGLGVFVYPKTGTSVSVKINVLAYWEKDGVIMGTATTNGIHLGYSSDLVLNNTEYYYKKSITSPTYINILEYIMLTAQGDYDAIWRNGYKLVISSVSVDFNTTALSATSPNYSINNSTTYSPILSRYTDGGTSKDINVSLTNQGTNPIKITSFKVKGKMWYPNNSDQLNYNEVVTYLDSASPFVYDTDLWDVTYSNDVYTFTAKSSAYITFGYEMQLIKGVTVPAYTFETIESQTEYMVYDRWFAIEIESITVEEYSTYQANTTYSNIETAVLNYFVPLDADAEGYITIKNNTNQIITSATIDLTLMKLESGESLRQEGDTSTSFNYTLISGADFTSTSSKTSTVLSNYTIDNLYIMPNERVILCKIKPSLRCLINTYSIKVNLSSGEADTSVVVLRKIGQIDDDYNNSCVINLTTKAYQFRLYSPNQELTTAMLGTDFIIDSTKHYAYYRGVVYANQVINLGNGLINNQKYELQKFEHNLTGTLSYGTDWTGVPAEWLTAMKKIFETPTNIVDKIINAN